MPQKSLSGQELQQAFLRGVQKLNKIVSSTLGPRGHNVVLSVSGKPIISTKDGVTVAKTVQLDDCFENLGSQVVVQAALKTEKDCGDGTTSTVLLAYELLKETQKYLVSGCSVYDLQKGIDKAISQVLVYLRDQSIPIKSKQDIANIATIAANNDQSIGRLISEAIDQVGKDGSIIVEETKSPQTVLSILEGFRFDAGWASSAFLDPEARRAFIRYENPMILVSDKKISTLREIMPALELIAREKRPGVLISDRIESEALGALIYNAKKHNVQGGGLEIVAINAPRYGEEKRNILKDLCVATGATLISAENGLAFKDIQLGHFGKSHSIEVTQNSTTIIDGGGEQEKIINKIEQLKAMIQEEENLQACETIQERISRLSSGIAVLRIGGSSDIDVAEKRFRIDDALLSVRSAQELGCLPGGGVALRRASEEIKEEGSLAEQYGARVVKRAICRVFELIVETTGNVPELVWREIKENDDNSVGFNAQTGEVGDLFKSGIIDATKVILSSLSNAVSVVNHLVSSDNAIVEV